MCPWYSWRHLHFSGFQKWPWQKKFKNHCCRQMNTNAHTYTVGQVLATEIKITFWLEYFPNYSQISRLYKNILCCLLRPYLSPFVLLQQSINFILSCWNDLFSATISVTRSNSDVFLFLLYLLIYWKKRAETVLPCPVFPSYKPSFTRINIEILFSQWQPAVT